MCRGCSACVLETYTQDEEDRRAVLMRVMNRVEVLLMTCMVLVLWRSGDGGKTTTAPLAVVMIFHCRLQIKTFNLVGIILTNRHVVKPGPVVVEATFVNREEIPVYPIYRDPVHDFGFFRYDSAAIQFLSYEEIPLAPEAACVGLEIRVFGKDSGEKVYTYR
ncbi:hypothetical protein L2E82_09796 [Cichorium intybus]|uniref:Uncharacterized protein n=1 Tax=Cichorium intybus TaxID=13427 RepID=A0ACB9G9U1_CICIN|nr:hypothetical protein L2E82_09796 [Cichorium intybus]